MEMGMDIRKPIGFSVKLCAFYAQQERFLNDRLRTQGLISARDFPILYALYEANQPIPVENLARFLMLKTRTIRKSLLSLEDCGLVIKECDPNDRRKALCSLTKEGQLSTEKSARYWFDAHNDVTQKHLPQSDLEETLRLTMRTCLNHLRGYSVEPFDQPPYQSLVPIGVDHLVFWRLMLNRWSRIVREKCDLTLNEFCVLLELDERGPRHISEVAIDMLQPSSVVSLCKKCLLAKKLISVEHSKKDHRVVAISITAKGNAIVESALGSLNSLTVEAHSEVNEEQMEIINAWYARMFINVWKTSR